MPSITIGSTTASVIQFVVVMTILSTVLNTHTSSGAGILPIGTANELNGLVNATNQTFISTTSQNSLQTQLRGQYNYSANQINPGILQTLGGLAFIPAAFGQFMLTLWSIPRTMIFIFQTLLTFQSPYVLLPFSVMALSAGLMAYYVMFFVYKLFTPITKTEIEEIAVLPIMPIVGAGSVFHLILGICISLLLVIILRNQKGQFVKGSPSPKYWLNKPSPNKGKHLWENKKHPRGMLGKKHSNQTKNRIIDSLLGNKRAVGMIHTEEYRENMHKRMAGLNNPSNREDVKEKISQGLIKHYQLHPERREKQRQITFLRALPKQKNTDIELKIADQLDKLNIDYTRFKTVMNLTQPDFFIAPNICVYADGDYWHNKKEVAYKDRYINRALKENGYSVIRILGSEIKKNDFKIANYLQDYVIQ